VLFWAQPRWSGIVAMENLLNPSTGRHLNHFATSKGFVCFSTASGPAAHQRINSTFTGRKIF
jgi:hypothetical protein